MVIDIVNRQRELALLQEFLYEPHPSALLVRGSPGIGKTYLLRHFGEIAAKEGHWVHYLSLHPFRGSTELIYQFTEALSSGKQLIGSEANRWKEALQPNPKIRELFSLLLAYSSAVDAPSHLQLLLGLIAQQLTSERKLLIIFDEIDATVNQERTVLFLESILKVASEHVHVKLIFSSRPIYILDRLARHQPVSTLEMQGFSVGDIKEYANVFLPEATTVRDEVLEKIAELSQGMPLFLSYLFEEAARTGFLPKEIDAFGISPTVGEIIERQINALLQDDKNGLDLLKAMAALGGNTTPNSLENLLEATELELQDIIEKLLRSGFIRKNQNGSIVFIHQLIR